MRGYSFHGHVFLVNSDQDTNIHDTYIGHHNRSKISVRKNTNLLFQNETKNTVIQEGASLFPWKYGK